jgi:acetolactate synthase-1/2/3 large subunit
MNNRQYTVADALLETLHLHRISTIFGYPGGAILPFYDALPHHEDIRHILVRNEQGAAFAAQGWARTRNEIGVCCTTSGPGATNAVTGIADAYMDSVPLLFITGQVPLEMIGKDMFQETDMTGVTLNITKHNYLLDDPEKVVPVVTEAIYIATHGRKGPVHIDVPKNIMAASHSRKIELPKISFQETVPCKKASEGVKKTELDEVVKLLSEAQKPVLLVGHGVGLSGAENEINTLIRKLKIPTVTTLLGKGTADCKNADYLGMLGMHGRYEANMAVHNADLILNVGSRFDDRIVGRYDVFGKEAKIIHVDMDKAELGKVVKPTLAIHSDARCFLSELLDHESLKPLQIEGWKEEIKRWRKDSPLAYDAKKMTMRSVLQRLNEVIEKNPDQYILVTDVGQHQMETALSCLVSRAHHWLTSGGSGTMGFGLPTAVGAAFANPDKTVINICGDGGIQMNVQELGVVAEHNLNIKTLILNNSFLGMVRQWQELFYEHNYSAVDIKSPNYPKLAEAYGLKGVRITEQEALSSEFKLLNKKGPVVYEVVVEREENIFPMVPGGKTLGETITE